MSGEKSFVAQSADKSFVAPETDKSFVAPETKEFKEPLPVNQTLTSEPLLSETQQAKPDYLESNVTIGAPEELIAQPE